MELPIPVAACASACAVAQIVCESVATSEYRHSERRKPDMKPNSSFLTSSSLVGIGVLSLLALNASGQVSKQTLDSLSTPDKVETRIGTLDFKDGMPSQETLEKVYDNLDFTHAFEAFVNTMQGVSIDALHKGYLSAGVIRLG
jgi:hypothetical protein